MTRAARLSYEEIANVIRYEPETGKLFWINRPHLEGKEALNCNSAGYGKGCILGGKYSSHRVAWLLHYGGWPEGTIDHIDGNRRNNRISNLRSVSISVNGRNKCMRSNNSSGHTGVRWSTEKRKWRAELKVDGRYMSLGYFAKLDDAVKARQEANKLHGFTPRHGLSSEASP